MANGHAVLGPSGAHRWISCPASIRVSAQIKRDPGEASPYAHEGTVAHALAEIEGRYAFELISHEEYTLEYEAWRQAANLDLDTLGEMKHHIAGYVAFLQERFDALPDAVILFEQRLSAGIDECWGTSDAVIFNPTVVEIHDLKYGQGHPVSPENNEQEMLYGLGALDEYGDLVADTTRVVLGIYQPRVPGGIQVWETTPEVLREWREKVARPAATLALSDDAPFGPSEKACRWCPAAGECKVRAQFLAAEDFGAPYVDVQKADLLDPAEMSTVLDRIPQIRQWCDDVQEAALRRLYVEDEEIPGWKAVLSGGRRAVTDKAAAIQTLIDAGFPAEKVARFDLKPLGELEKVIKTAYGDQGGEVPTLDTILGGLIKKGEGKPSLARASDKRPNINRMSEAAKDFS